MSDYVIPEQKRISVYDNIHGAVVIRAEEQDQDDSLIIIQPFYIEKLISALRRVRREMGGTV